MASLSWQSVLLICALSIATVRSKCSGGSKSEMRECCSKTNPCDLGQGDCDSDTECAGDLICGRNNCGHEFLWSGADCCTKKQGDERCKTNNDGPKVQVPCIFPFKFKDTRHYGCITDGNDPGDNRPWCSTKVDSDGVHVGGQSEWGYCGNSCPKSTPETPETPTSCGLLGFSEIVGGSEVRPHSLPWQVALVYRGSSRPWCGGTLISNRHVLTAAHCTESNMDVIVGEHRVTSSSDGTRHGYCRYNNHPNYVKSNSNNDFSIIHLNEPVKIGNRVSPACLPPTSMGGNFLAGKTMTVSGWGHTTENGNNSPVLRSVDVPGITNAQCNELIGGITNAMVCAGNVANGGIDSCQNDSGGPLTYTTGGKTYLVGVVSFGYGCAREGNPGVYSRVTDALGWINQQLNQRC